jgi:hypothetical protein
VELDELLGDSDLRRHMRTLLLQFLGQVERPDDFEYRWMGRALDDPGTHLAAVGAIAGRRDWFGRLVNRIAGYMTSKPSSAASLLFGVIASEHDAVFEYVRRYWAPNLGEHVRVAWLLRAAKKWTEQEIDLARTVLARGHVPDHSVHSLLMTARKMARDAAPTLYATELERIESEARSKMVIEPPPSPDAGEGEQMRWQLRREPRKTLQNLLHQAANLPELMGLAEAEPAGFLQALWPWFVRVVDELAEHVGYLELTFRHAYAYEADPWATDHFIFGAAIGTAVGALARNDRGGWSAFVAANDGSDIDIVHQCILRGFDAALPEVAEELADYLVADPRRLTVGDSMGSDAVRLLGKVAPHLAEERRQALAKAIERVRLVDETDDVKPEGRRRRLEVNRHHVARLETSLRGDGTSAPSEGLDDEHGVARVIGSHVSADQMARMRNRHVLRLFDELVDETDFTHPTRFMSGGSVQASRVLGEVVKKHPERLERYAALAKRFQPGRTERPAGAIFEALLESGYGLRNGGLLLEELQSLGFRSEQFRWVAAYALEKAATKNEAIQWSSLKVLESWLHDADEHEEVASSNNDTKAIIWGWGDGGSLPWGNFPTLWALTRLLLERPVPELQALMDILTRHLERQESPRVWAAMLPRLAALAMGGEAGALILRRLFEKFPAVRDSSVGVRLVARTTSWARDDLVREWVEAINGASWTFGRRAAGELLGLMGTESVPRPWVEAALERCMSEAGATEERRGILTSAAHLWTAAGRRGKATALLVRGCSVASTPQERDVIMRTLDVSRENLWDEHTVAFLETLSTHPSVLAGDSHQFGERMDQILLEDPDLVSRVVLQFVRLRLATPEAKDASFFDAGATLANMAVTLHRMEEPMSDRGLDLLELLLEAESFGARELVSDVDRRLDSASQWS